MNFLINDLLQIKGTQYKIVGMIKYRNHTDNETWTEYRLISTADGREKWLSIDDTYKEYSLSEMTNNSDPGNYKKVDSGTQEVVNRGGDVDVDIGDRAKFTEYEDETEEYIFSVEKWSDGTEYSKGFYLDQDEIVKTGGSTNYYSDVETKSNSANYSANYSYTPKKKKNPFNVIMVVVIFVPVLLSLFKGFFSGTTKISSYLKKSDSFTYVTSITGKEKQKADVYKSSMDIDLTTKNIIDAIDGNVEEIKQNTEDNDKSVGILTNNEYCLVYIAENEDVLVQISNRKYAYYNDDSPYHSTRATHRYYRRFYHSMGYTTDSASYKSDSSPYTTFQDSNVTSDSNDTYKSYAGSVRQQSVNTRTTDGGGTNFGK